MLVASHIPLTQHQTWIVHPGLMHFHMVVVHDILVAATPGGGEQQMAAAACGLMAESVVFMIDELSLFLLPVSSKQLLEALLTLKKSGMTFLLVEQNVQMALTISDYAFVRNDLQCPSRELMKKVKIRAAYLGMESHHDG